MLLIGLYENDSIQMKETELSELFERVHRLEACQLKAQEMVLEGFQLFRDQAGGCGSF